MHPDEFNPSKLKLTGRRINRPSILGLVFLLCLGAGLLSGQIFKANNKPADAASAYISVTDNNQIVTVDQATGDQIIQRTSRVTVKDPTAKDGYTLSAKLSQNSMSGAIVTMGNANSIACPLATPCNLNDTAARPITSTNNNNATVGDGDTTEWQVKITIPAGTELGNYIIDIEYSEASIIAMQDYTGAQCQAASAGSMFTMRDERDGTYYRVKKMIDGNCWMVDNLALDLATDYDGKPSWGTAPVTVSGTDASANNVPQQAQNNNVAGQGQIPNNGVAKASYLYNWCAALGDTSADCAASVAAVQYDTVIDGTTVTTGTATEQPEVTGICPAPFRLPKGGPEATSSDASTTASEFGKLDIAMGGTGANRVDATHRALWMGTTTTTNTHWHGVLGGGYGNSLNVQGSSGLWWSSTAYGAIHTYRMGLTSNSTVRPTSASEKLNSYAVRCVLNPSDPDLTEITNMQEMTEQVCAISSAGAMKSLRDERDGTYYRVKKMADGNCWMVDNLALDLTSDYIGKPAWNTAPVTVSGTTTSVNNVPQQILNNNTGGEGQIPNNGSAKASYLYNWCAALADTSSACAASVAATQYNTVISGVRDTSGTATTQPAVTGICPAPFRLPKGGPEATSSSKDTTANEFAKLDIAMGGTGASRTSANTYPLFTGTAAANTNWLGVFSGSYGNGLGGQGSVGVWWFSTAYSATDAYYLYLNSSITLVNPAAVFGGTKIHGFAVRCVL